jgi:hypothetical protein
MWEVAVQHVIPDLFCSLLPPSVFGFHKVWPCQWTDFRSTNRTETCRSCEWQWLLYQFYTQIKCIRIIFRRQMKRYFGIISWLVSAGDFKTDHHSTNSSLITSAELQVTFQDVHKLTDYLKHFIIPTVGRKLPTKPIYMPNSKLQQSYQN